VNNVARRILTSPYSPFEGESRRRRQGVKTLQIGIHSHLLLSARIGKRTVAILALTAALLTSIPGQIRATTVERLSLEDLTRRAHSIVMGRVRGARTYWSSDRRLILTTTTVEVAETIKGRTRGAVELTTIGGRVGNTVLHVAGMPAFTDGEETIIFLEQSGSYSTVVGLGQGKFTVADGEVANAVSDLTFPDGQRPRQLKMPLETFKQRIRSILNRRP